MITDEWQCRKQKDIVKKLASILYTHQSHIEIIYIYDIIF